MPTTLPLLHENITFTEARERETNTLLHLTYPEAQRKFYNFLSQRQLLIQQRVAHHLNLSSHHVCHVAAPQDWMQGSFNLCIPVAVSSSKQQRVLLRFPLPHRVGEDTCPGNGDEKLRCEAATYEWIRQECPNVPIPHLYGFALSTGQCFTAVQHRPLLIRSFQWIRRQFLSALRLPTPSTLIPHQPSRPSDLGGYLLLEYIEESRGRVLSKTWEAQRTNKELRKKLFRSFSQIMLEMARIPLPRIGSFHIDDRGYLRLSNRPLTLEIQDLENERIPSTISRDRTYHSVNAYIDDIFMYHENRLRCQPNAVSSVFDGVSQICAITLIRMLRPLFFKDELNEGPFVLCLTDLSPNNILVDDHWNVTYVIDLEWAAVLPLEFLQTPYWLTNQAVDVIDLDQYSQLREEFVEILRKEERSIVQGNGGQYSSILDSTWGIGTFWYVLALQSPTGLHRLFYERILPRFDVNGKGHTFWKSHYLWKHYDFWMIPGFWKYQQFFMDVYPHFADDAHDLILRKVQDKADYDENMSKAFQ